MAKRIVKGLATTEVADTQAVLDEAPPPIEALREPPPQPILTEKVVAAEEETVVVKKQELYRMAYSLVLGHPIYFTGTAGMMMIGKMLGAGTYDEQLKKWDEIKDYIGKHPY